MHLRTKLVIALLGLALVPCLVLGVFSYATSAGVVRQKVDGLTDADLARLARSVEAVMEQVNLSLLWFSTNETFVGLLSALDEAHAAAKPGETYETSLKLDRMIGGFFPLVLTMDAVGYASIAGARYGMSAYPADVAAVASSPAFGAFAEAGAAVSWIGPVPDPAPFHRGERAFVAGRQLRDTAYGAGGEPVGVLMFWISDRIFGDLVDAGTGTDGSRAPTMICDAAGTPVAGDAAAALRELPGSPAWARIIATADGSFAADFDGGRYTVFHRSLRFAGWKLVRLVPAAYYTTELRWIGLVDLGLVFACLAAAVSLAVLLSRVVSRPIGEIARAMERVGRRDFSATVPVRTRDELGTVAAGFNAMTGQLDRLFREAVGREREVQRATLRALRYQVNPHLLANTLASIRLTALAAGDGRAAGMLATLSRLLRRTLSQADDLVALAAEIENLRDWIAVMQVRYLDRIDVRIDVDPTLARRLVPPMVLQPLVENAVLHGLSARLNEEDGGAVLEVTAADRDGTLVLSVRDNGRGMSPDKVAAAFARDPESAGPDGAGAIGIANVHARVRAQFGGSAGLAIESTPGQGTTAVITLPSGGGDWVKRVLIVDDEPFFRSALRALLPWEKHGFAVAGEAIDGAEALAFLRREPVDVVFTDIRMPVMDGIELIRTARAEGIGARFVVLSAYDDFGLVKGAFLEGARDYLLKPELAADRVLAALSRLDGPAGPLPMEPPGRRVCLACFEIDDGPVERLVETLRSEAVVHGGEVLPLDDPGQAAVALRFDPDRPLTEVVAEVESFASGVAAKVRGASGATVTCGVSAAVGGAPDLARLAEEARRACAYGFLRGRGKVINASRVPSAARATFERGGPARLAALLARRDADGLRDALPRLLPSDPRLTVEDIPSVRAHYAACLDVLEEFAASAPAVDTTRVRAQAARLRERLAGSADVPELNGLLREALGTTAAVIGGASRLLRGALALVHDDPGAPLSLAAAARRLAVTPAYLSRVFSHEMGVSFTTYLAGVRMRAAAALLSGSTLKVHEVAERVGYASVEHFSRMFRRVMGASPREYAKAGARE